MTAAYVGQPVVRTGERGHGSDYAVLLRRVREAGLMRRRPSYYVRKTAVVVAALAVGWGVFVALGDSWWQLLTAVFLGAVFPQLAFLGHDAGHRQVFRTRRANHLYGLLVGNLGIGVSIGWWTGNHNRHHANPNTEGADPDIAGVLVYSPDRARTERGFRKWIFRYQGWLFFPLVFLEAGSLHSKSVRAVICGEVSNRFREGLLLAAHAVGLVAAAFAVLSPVQAVVFLAVQQGVFGFYMGCTFAPNHKGMEVFGPDDTIDYLRRQVLTSRTVRGGWLLDAAMGGLNYQIEHHLFPSMPRCSLRRAQPLIVEYCAEIGVPYREAGLFDSYRQAVGFLHDVGKHARPGAS